MSSPALMSRLYPTVLRMPTPRRGSNETSHSLLTSRYANGIGLPSSAALNCSEAPPAVSSIFEILKTTTGPRILSCLELTLLPTDCYSTAAQPNREMKVF